MAEVAINDRGGKGAHGDFATPEYQVVEDIQEPHWEATRGIGFSFGYNQFETERMYLTSDELVDLLVDVVSKNGNLLLNIGPRADGTVIPLMQERLRDMGAWLAVNGEAIYGSRPGRWSSPYRRAARKRSRAALPGCFGSRAELTSRASCT